MASKNRMVAIGLRVMVLSCVAVAVNSHEAAQSGPPSTADEQRMEQEYKTLMQLEVGAAPLVVIGDVNEDGKVDATDLALMQQLAAGKSPAAATCPAAADFNQDGKIDATDVAAMQALLSQGSAAAFSLGFPYSLPCSFKRMLVAAHPKADELGMNSVYFLDSKFTTENSTVAEQTGKAVVTPTADKRGFIVTAQSDPGESGTLVLKITLGKNGSGGTFTYSYHYGP